ncbi:hypothetical protein B566_EDAN005939 [Ephemera danica]|nr:hypothetical protein B566_EDAN005939 [Ephemera danica]
MATPTNCHGHLRTLAANGGIVDIQVNSKYTINVARAAQCAVVHIAMEDNCAVPGPRTMGDTHKTLRRSGSWSGVNESEEEIEAMNLQLDSRRTGSENAVPIDAAEEKMRRKLRFFFMNPIEKWQAKRRFPYKFIVQVIKIVFVTAQLWLFAKSRYTHVDYTWDNKVAFSHLFLRGWDAIREYYNLSNAIGPYSYPNEDNTMPSTVLCLSQYKEGSIFGFNESYIFNNEIVKRCINVTVPNDVATFSSKDFLNRQRLPVNFSALVSATLEFSVKTVNFKSAGTLTPPDCFCFNIEQVQQIQ